MNESGSEDEISVFKNIDNFFAENKNIIERPKVLIAFLQELKEKYPITYKSAIPKVAKRYINLLKESEETKGKKAFLKKTLDFLKLVRKEDEILFYDVFKFFRSEIVEYAKKNITEPIIFQILTSYQELGHDAFSQLVKEISIEIHEILVNQLLKIDFDNIFKGFQNYIVSTLSKNEIPVGKYEISAFRELLQEIKKTLPGLLPLLDFLLILEYLDTLIPGYSSSFASFIVQKIKFSKNKDVISQIYLIKKISERTHYLANSLLLLLKEDLDKDFEDFASSDMEKKAILAKILSHMDNSTLSLIISLHPKHLEKILSSLSGNEILNLSELAYLKSPENLKTLVENYPSVFLNAVDYLFSYNKEHLPKYCMLIHSANPKSVDMFFDKIVEHLQLNNGNLDSGTIQMLFEILPMFNKEKSVEIIKNNIPKITEYINSANIIDVTQYIFIPSTHTHKDIFSNLFESTFRTIFNNKLKQSKLNELAELIIYFAFRRENFVEEEPLVEKLAESYIQEKIRGATLKEILEYLQYLRVHSLNLCKAHYAKYVSNLDLSEKMKKATPEQTLQFLELLQEIYDGTLLFSEKIIKRYSNAIIEILKFASLIDGLKFLKFVPTTDKVKDLLKDKLRKALKENDLSTALNYFEKLSKEEELIDLPELWLEGMYVLRDLFIESNHLKLSEFLNSIIKVATWRFFKVNPFAEELYNKEAQRIMAMFLKSYLKPIADKLAKDENKKLIDFIIELAKHNRVLATDICKEYKDVIAGASLEIPVDKKIMLTKALVNLPISEETQYVLTKIVNEEIFNKLNLYESLKLIALTMFISSKVHNELKQKWSHVLQHKETEEILRSLPYLLFMKRSAKSKVKQLATELLDSLRHHIEPIMHSMTYDERILFLKQVLQLDDFETALRSLISSNPELIIDEKIFIQLPQHKKESIYELLRWWIPDLAKRLDKLMKEHYEVEKLPSIGLKEKDTLNEELLSELKRLFRKRSDGEE
ncbi:MAG: hypothetical protein ACP6IS_07920 [Candidatus Asgardarchaeia archaeon]